MQALWHGKPVVALPHNIDQATIASRLVELGVGTNLNPIGPGDLADIDRYFKRATEISWQSAVDQVEAVLRNTAVRCRAARFREKMRRYGTAAQSAADHVMRYAGAGRAW